MLLCETRCHEVALDSESQHHLQDGSASVAASSDVDGYLVSVLSVTCVQMHESTSHDQ